jgi:hypothetical protein
MTEEKTCCRSCYCTGGCSPQRKLKRSKPAIMSPLVRKYLHDLYGDLRKPTTEKDFCVTPYLEAIELLLYGAVPRRHGRRDR